MPSTDLCLFWYNVISLCLSLCLPPAVLFLLSLSLLVTGTFFLFGIVTYISRHLFSRISILSSFGFVTLQHIFVRTMIYAVIKHWYMQNLFDFCQVLHFFSPFNSSLKCNSWAILVVLKMPTKEQYSEKGKSFSFTKWFQTMTLRRYSDTLILVNLMRKKRHSNSIFWNCFVTQTRVIQNCWVTLCDRITADSWLYIKKPKNRPFSLQFTSPSWKKFVYLLSKLTS